MQKTVFNKLQMLTFSYVLLWKKHYKQIFRTGTVVKLMCVCFRGIISEGVTLRMPAMQPINNYYYQGPIILALQMYLLSHSSLNTPPRAFAPMPGGNTQGISGPPCLASDASRAKPWNLPLSFTEKIKMTFLYLWKVKGNANSCLIYLLHGYTKFGIVALQKYNPVMHHRTGI